jgi:hypothetical protein
MAGVVHIAVAPCRVAVYTGVGAQRRVVVRTGVGAQRRVVVRGSDLGVRNRGTNAAILVGDRSLVGSAVRMVGPEVVDDSEAEGHEVAPGAVGCRVLGAQETVQQTVLGVERYPVRADEVDHWSPLFSGPPRCASAVPPASPGPSLPQDHS